MNAEQPVSTAVENFADELRAWRERLGWSQADLGAGMGYSGSHVSSVETMSRTATLCTRPADSFGRTLRHKSGETS